MTISELVERIKHSVYPNPVVIADMPPMFDLKGFFKPHRVNDWSQISKYRAFKLELHPDKYPVIFSRQIMAGSRQLGFSRGKYHTSYTTMSVASYQRKILKKVAWDPEFGQPVLHSYPPARTPCMLVPTRELPYRDIRKTISAAKEWVNSRKTSR